MLAVVLASVVEGDHENVRRSTVPSKVRRRHEPRAGADEAWERGPNWAPPALGGAATSRSGSHGWLLPKMRVATWGAAGRRSIDVHTGAHKPKPSRSSRCFLVYNTAENPSLSCILCAISTPVSKITRRTCLPSCGVASTPAAVITPCIRHRQRRSFRCEPWLLGEWRSPRGPTVVRIR